MEKKIENFPLILLAGGQSSRMGMPKGLLDYHGHPWLWEQLKRFTNASGKRVIIVLGFHQAPYFKQIPWMEKAVNQSVYHLELEVSVAINPAPEYGPFSSLQKAIKFLQSMPFGIVEGRRPNAELSSRSGTNIGAFLLPIDVPCPGKEVFEILVRAFSYSIDAAIPRYQSRGGHPVLLGGDFLSRLAEVPLQSPQARLDLQIQALPVKRTVFVPVEDKNICLNINSMEEFQDYTKRKDQSGCA